MTLDDILSRYNELKNHGLKYDDWEELDEFMEELAQMASGTPMLPGELYEEIFNEVRDRK